jgi:hypothetical protein
MRLVATIQAIRAGNVRGRTGLPQEYTFHLSTEIMRDVSVAEILVMIVDKSPFNS